MPTSGDLKSGASLFFFTNHPTNWPSPQCECFRTLYEVLHEVHTIKTRNHSFDARNNLCQWLNTCKNASETVMWIRKNQVLSYKWAKSQAIKAQKSSKDDFIRDIWWPVRGSGRSVPYPGDARIIQEGWHVCICTQPSPKIHLYKKYNFIKRTARVVSSLPSVMFLYLSILRTPFLTL